MNYYEHHIRDYDAATSHLTWEEDLAYTRLLRWYYRKEKPIPADIKEACRQVRAVTKVQRDAVEAVLGEFFELMEDGWHNETCDEVIAAYQAGEPEREAKKANEENRLKKHREERSRLFKVLTEAGGHAPWNIKIEELREMVKRVQAMKLETAQETKPATPATAPATPATATQYPVPSTQTPVVNNQRNSSVVGVPDADAESTTSPDRDDGTRLGSLCKELRKLGFDCAPHLEAWTILLPSYSDAEIIGAAQSARDAKPGERLHLNYLVPKLRDRAAVKQAQPSDRLSAAGRATAEAAQRWLESQEGEA